MSKLGEDIFLGRLGEAYVQWLFHKHAIKRVSDQGDDIGIDLYCEGLTTAGQDHHPLNHFWVQVRTTALEKPSAEELRDASEDETRGKKLAKALKIEVKKSEVDYWLRQPVPVYLFRVAWPPQDSQIGLGNVAVYDIVKWANDYGDELLSKGQVSFTLSPGSSYSVALMEDGLPDVGRHTIYSFVRGHVAYSHSLHAGRRGVWRPSPDLKSELKECHPAGITGVSPPRFRNRFLARLFGTARHISKLMERGDWPKDEGVEKLCEQIRTSSIGLAGMSEQELLDVVLTQDLIH